MTKEELKNYWRITLKKGKRELVQYINAVSFDEAIKKAQNTFHARLDNLTGEEVTKEGQKSCKNRIIRKPILFDFGNGWTTVHPCNKNIFDMLEEAQKRQFVNGKEILEIYAHYGR